MASDILMKPRRYFTVAQLCLCAIGFCVYAQTAPANQLSTGSAAIDRPVSESVSNVSPATPSNSERESLLIAAWNDRQKAREKGATQDVLELEKRILSLRNTIGYSDLFGMSAAVAFEAEGLLGSNKQEATRLARFATELAPTMPSAHWLLARAFLNENFDIASAIGSSWRAVEASVGEPRWRSALFAETAFFAISAFLIAGAVSLLLISIRALPRFLHDFHHILPAGVSPIPSKLLGLVTLLAPLGLALGMFAFFLWLALAAWLYLQRQERVMAGVFIILLGIVPSAMSWVESGAAFSGTQGEALWLIDREGGLEGAGSIAHLKELADRSKAGSFEILLILGRQSRRNGDASQALTLLRRAAEIKASAEVLIEIGNALVMLGDFDGANDTYQQVANSSESSKTARAQAYFNLAQLSARRAKSAGTEESNPELAKAQELRRKAADADAKVFALLSSRGGDYLAEIEPSPRFFQNVATIEGNPGWVSDRMGKLLFGVMPKGLMLPSALAGTGMLLLLSLFGNLFKRSGQCSKCGRPICGRCDARASVRGSWSGIAQGLCGQCVSVFMNRSSVDPQARLTKEIEVKRFRRIREISIKAISFMLIGSGHLLIGETVTGAILVFGALFFGLPLFVGSFVPVPAGSFPLLLRVILLSLGLVILWLFGLRRIFQRMAD